MGALAPAILKSRLLAPTTFGHFSTVGKKLRVLNKNLIKVNTTYERPLMTSQLHRLWCFLYREKMCQLTHVRKKTPQTVQL